MANPPLPPLSLASCLQPLPARHSRPASGSRPCTVECFLSLTSAGRPVCLFRNDPFACRIYFEALSRPRPPPHDSWTFHVTGHEQSSCARRSFGSFQLSIQPFACSHFVLLDGTEERHDKVVTTKPKRPSGFRWANLPPAVGFVQLPSHCPRTVGLVSKPFSVAGPWLPDPSFAHFADFLSQRPSFMPIILVHRPRGGGEPQSSVEFQ